MRIYAELGLGNRVMKFIESELPAAWAGNIVDVTGEDLELIRGKVYNVQTQLWEEPVSVPDLETERRAKLDEVKAYIDLQYANYLSRYPYVEARSFKDKAREAIAVNADPALPLADTFYLSVLTGNTTIEARNALADAVLAKITDMAALEAAGVTLRGAVKAAATIADLEAVTW